MAAAAAAEAAREAERKRFTTKFYYGRAEDSPWNHDLNWKDQCAKEKREMAALERRNKELAENGRASTRQYHPDRFFGPAGSLATPFQDEKPQGKSSKNNPMLTEDTFSNIFPGIDSPIKRSQLAKAGSMAVSPMAGAGESKRGGPAVPETTAGGSRQQAARRGRTPNPWAARPEMETTASSKKLRTSIRKAKLQQKAAKERIARRRLEEKARELQAELERQRRANPKHTYKTRKTVMP